MTSDRSDDCTSQLQSLLGSDVAPNSGLSSGARGRLSAAKRALDQNYYELEEYVDGKVPTNPMFICRTERKREEGFEVLRLLHNYLASIYSFNETIRVLCNRHTPASVELATSDFTSVSDDGSSSYYSRKLGFLRGLRTDFQHGGFSCFSFIKAGELGDFAGYHVRFDRDSFVNDSGLHAPERFLRHTNESERRHPLCFIGRFHRTTLQQFYADVESWFDAA